MKERQIASVSNLVPTTVLVLEGTLGRLDIHCALKAVKIVSDSLSLCGGCDDCPLILLENLQPAFEIGRCVLARIVLNAKVCAYEGRRKFGNELFHGIGFRPEPAGKIAIQTLFCAGPVRFMPISA